MQLLELHVYRPAAQLSYVMPAQCPLATDQVLFLEHESRKYRVHANRWKCGYCNKQFRGEHFLDQHMDAKHTPEDAHGLCMGDYCDILNCPSARAHTRHAKCSHNTVFRRKQQCKALFQQCFPYEAPGINTMRRSDPAPNILFEHVSEHVCEAINCDAYEDEEAPSILGGLIMLLKVLGFVAFIVLLVVFLERPTKTVRPDMPRRAKRY
ncbi:hypothetical protein ACHHYP_07420 [Achlya hypogyna]|uniref:C2H2-type domain-containing protein n=1 Tax=Achlya hypogyna TaxID=1202772 RepID=A0A1V9ZM24_ACHHY|nr:hypothetical protein ACHHYP_07420 [Achlya hypogyna]